MILYNDFKKFDSKEKDKERMMFIENNLKKEDVDYIRINGEFKIVFFKKSDFNVRIMKEFKYLEIIEIIGVKFISFEDNECILLLLLSLLGNNNVKENIIVGNRGLKVVK